MRAFTIFATVIGSPACTVRLFYTQKLPITKKEIVMKMKLHHICF